MIDKNMEAVQICGGSLVEIQPIITADSRYLICGNGSKMSIFSCSNGERCRVFKGHETKVVCMFQMDENNSTIVSGSADGRIILWSFEDGTVTRKFNLGRKLIYFHLINNIDDDDDAPKICYGIVERDGEKLDLVEFTIPREEKDSELELKVLTDVECNPNMFAFGAQNSIFVFAMNKKLKVFKLKSREMFCHKAQQKISSIACHPNERMVATGMQDGKIIIWKDICGPRPIINDYHWHSLSLRTVHFSLDGASLYTGGYECVLAIWSLIDMKRTVLPRLGSPIARIATSVDGSIVAVCNVHNGIQLIDSSLKVLQVIQGVSQVCKEIPVKGTRNINHDVKTGLVFFVGIPGHLQFYDPFKDSHVFNLDVTKENYTSPENLANPNPCTLVTHISLSEDGMWMVTAQSLIYPNKVRIETALKFWKRSAGSFDFHGKYELEDTMVTSIAAGNYKKAGFVPTFATTLSDGSISTWEYVDGEDVNGKAKQIWRHGFSADYRNPRSCSFSCDGSVLGVVHDTCLTMWNVVGQRRERVLSLFGEKETPKSIVFGQKFHSNIFYSSSDKSLVCWSLKNDERWKTPLDVNIMIGNRNSEDLIVFTQKSTIEIFTPRSSTSTMSINLVGPSPIVSACLKGGHLLFLNKDQELFMLSDGDTEMTCDEPTGSEPMDVNLLSHLTANTDRTKERDTQIQPLAVDKALILSDTWGEEFLEMITPKWRVEREFEVNLPEDYENEIFENGV